MNVKIVKETYCLSALATTPASISAQAGAKEAINFIETFTFLFFFSNYKNTTSKYHLNPSKRNMMNKLG
jgi:hypothetical protein